MLTEIVELESIKEQKQKLVEREMLLSYPRLSDTDLISVIYEWFNELKENSKPAGRNSIVHQKKQFLFIALYLFSPGVLAGNRLPTGLRNKIAKAMCLSDVSFISHNIDKVVFMHKNYKDFRNEVACVYEQILERLRTENLISGND